jgi:hypothetical protein
MAGPPRIWKGFSDASVFPHTPFELGRLHLNPDIAGGTYVVGWRLSAEDFVSPVTGFNIETFDIPAITPDPPAPTT